MNAQALIKPNVACHTEGGRTVALRPEARLRVHANRGRRGARWLHRRDCAECRPRLKDRLLLLLLLLLLWLLLRRRRRLLLLRQRLWWLLLRRRRLRRLRALRSIAVRLLLEVADVRAQLLNLAVAASQLQRARLDAAGPAWEYAPTQQGWAV